MNMNEVDYLISNRFSLMSLEEKLEVKRLGTHHPNDVHHTNYLNADSFIYIFYYYAVHYGTHCFY